MLAPRSAKALHVLIPENSHGMRNRPGSPSFLGNLFRMTAEQFSFKGVLAISLNFSLFPNFQFDLSFSRRLSSFLLEGNGIDACWLGLGTLTGSTTGSEIGF
ncbi:hypothetical protein Tco_1482439 [Tanacetum coccineum]